MAELDRELQENTNVNVKELAKRFVGTASGQPTSDRLPVQPISRTKVSKLAEAFGGKAKK
ncbi:MAG: hypothetical protein LBJ45_03330 [Holosporaceae bacterium]|nr:hypothetical protein [Holosporaceae bacterium]